MPLSPGALGAVSSSSAPPATSPRRQGAAPLLRLPASLTLLTGCSAAARPGPTRAAAANAALFSARRLHAGRRLQAGPPRVRTVLPALRPLRLLPRRGGNSRSLGALTQYHENAGPRAMLPALRKPAGTWLPAHAVPPPRPAPLRSLPRRRAPENRGISVTGARAPRGGLAWKQIPGRSRTPLVGIGSGADCPSQRLLWLRRSRMRDRSRAADSLTRRGRARLRPFGRGSSHLAGERRAEPSWLPRGRRGAGGAAAGGACVGRRVREGCC